MIDLDQEEFKRQVRPLLEMLVERLRSRFPKVSDERGKAILNEVLQKGFEAAKTEGAMPTKALFDELMRRFAAESG